MRRRFAKITVSSQKLRQLRRKRRKGSLRSKRFRASSTRKLGPERKKGAGGGWGEEKLAKQVRETDAGKRESSYNRKKAEIGRKRTKGNLKGIKKIKCQ